MLLQAIATLISKNPAQAQIDGTLFWILSALLLLMSIPVWETFKRKYVNINGWHIPTPWAYVVVVPFLLIVLCALLLIFWSLVDAMTACTYSVACVALGLIKGLFHLEAIGAVCIGGGYYGLWLLKSRQRDRDPQFLGLGLYYLFRDVRAEANHQLQLHHYPPMEDEQILTAKHAVDHYVNWFQIKAPTKYLAGRYLDEQKLLAALFSRHKFAILSPKEQIVVQAIVHVYTDTRNRAIDSNPLGRLRRWLFARGT